MRDIIVAGNWKMNTVHDSASELARGIVSLLEASELRKPVTVVLAPPAPFLSDVGRIIEETAVALGGQNMHQKPEGAFTGEISPLMLRSVGCRYVIVGHSERRTMFGESDYDVKMKANAAIDHDLRPIICVGETETEREQGRTFEVLKFQVREAFDGIFSEDAGQCVVAYEPVWAIGTGQIATPETAEDAHLFIRDLLASMYDRSVADSISIIYGGSLRADNAAAIFARPNVDGGLVGGASLKVDEFVEIVRAAGEQ